MRRLPLILLALLALAPTAEAATVRVETTCSNPTGKGPETCTGTLVFAAAAGEVNDVSAEPTAGFTIVLRDAGAPLTAGAGCTQVDAASVRCPDAAGSVALGDGNDRLALPVGRLAVSGDAGDDTLTAPGTVRGGDGDDTISGSALDGGAGNDRLTGTSGDDELFGGPGDDTIDGAGGFDTVAYGKSSLLPFVAAQPGPPLPVIVDLADPGPDGAAGERDTLIAVENVFGSAASGDLLRGDDGPNALRGEGGADRLLGAGGDDALAGGGVLDGGSGDDVLVGDDDGDTLRGGPGDDRLAGLGGADVLDAGAGDDLLDASEQQDERTTDVDELLCGAGRDRVSEPDIYDRASRCERIAIGGGLVADSSTLVKRAGPRVEVVVRCGRSDRRCVTQVASAAASGNAFSPRMRVSLAPGARRTIVITRFHPGGRARLRRSKVIAFGTKDHGFAVRLTSGPSAQRFRQQRQPFGGGRGVKAAVPSRYHEPIGREHERGREVQSIKAAQVAFASERRRMFHERLVDFDDAEGCPFPFERGGRARSADQADRPHRLDVAQPAHEPALGVLHRCPHDIAARFGHVALDECARVEVDVQRSASRSASTSAEALRSVVTMAGARAGRDRAGGTRRPSATSTRSRSSPATAPAGTMSAIARPRDVTRTCSPAPTARSVALKDRFSSLTPISRMWSP